MPAPELVLKKIAVSDDAQECASLLVARAKAKVRARLQPGSGGGVNVDLRFGGNDFILIGNCFTYL